MVLSRRGYKVFADISTTSANSVQNLTIFDTEAGPGLIRKNTLPIGYETYLKPGLLLNICDKNGSRTDMHGVVSL